MPHLASRADDDEAAPVSTDPILVRQWHAARIELAKAEQAMASATHAALLAGDGREAKRAASRLKGAEKALARAERIEKKLGAIARQAAALTRACLNLVPRAAAYEAGRRAVVPKRKRVKTAAEARPLAPAVVPSPYDRGVDLVERRLHSIEHMRASRQLDARQYEAAEIYRNAYETLPGALRCTLSIGAHVGAMSGGGPLPPQSLAFDVLRQAGELLGQTDGRVVELVCGEGYMLRDAAARMFQTTGQRAVDEVGMRVRRGLTVLADAWIAQPRRRMVSERQADARPPLTLTSNVVFVTPAAHASAWRVDYGGEQAGGRSRRRRV